jgi:hypothetical protein
MLTEIQATVRMLKGVRGVCVCLYGAILLLLMAVIPALNHAQSAIPAGLELRPQPAVAAILAAFDKHEVVGMSEGHGMKDVDDFILSLIRNPAFSLQVNDIEVECGNSLYQPILDRYIAGEDVPFTEVKKVWRNTTQPMCGTSGFFEQFFPLVRAINQKLPPEGRLRVLAGDPPIDWNQVMGAQDLGKFTDRDANIAAVMEKEVLSKHRKALMLFGIFHLMHGAGAGPGNAVTIIEKDYPNSTFVISDLGIFDTDRPDLSSSAFADWTAPSLARSKGTWLGALDLSHFYPPTIWTDEVCNVHNEFPKNEQKPMADLVDAFLYLGSQALRLAEPVPADIALDHTYMTELQWRKSLAGLPGVGTVADLDQQIVNGAASPVLVIPKLADAKAFFPFVRQSCLARKTATTSSAN